MPQLDAIMANLIQLSEDLDKAKTLEEYQEVSDRLARWLTLYKEQTNKKH